MAREDYANQVRLLVRVLPIIAKETVFALKGGTAINLFYRDMPRLSVDIDLTYLPIGDRATALTDIDQALGRVAVGKLRSSAWRRAWKAVGLPDEPGILKGVHNLRHTFGRRLRSAGIPLETRKALLGHANDDITTHYSAAELEELMIAAEAIVNRGRIESPNLMLIRQRTEENVGKVSAKRKGPAANIC